MASQGPRTKKTMHSRSRTKRSRSVSPQRFNYESLTDEQKAAIADLQEDCFAKIPIDKRLDASRYSVLQINTLKKIDSPLYRCLSFLHCSNELIHDTVLDESSNKPSEFPYNCRKDAITINKYAIAARKSPHQVEMYRQKSLEELHNVAQSLKSHMTECEVRHTI